MKDSLFVSQKRNRKIRNIEIKKPNHWTDEEDRILKEKAKEFNYKNWNSIANYIPGRSSIQCSARYRRIRPGLIKGPWKKEEDDKLKLLYKKYGNNWAAISKEMLNRTGKQIRDRFINSLDSKFKRGKFTEEEDKLIIKYYKIYGKCWTKIAKKLKTRTGDMVKNRFYSSLKKTILKKRNLSKKKKKRNIIDIKNSIKKENSLDINNKSKFKENESYNIDNELNIKKGYQKNISNPLDNIKDSIQENIKIKSQTNNNNIININSNNYSLNTYNSNNDIMVKNKIEKITNNFNDSIENKIENDNNNCGIINLDEDIKNKEVLNYSEFDDHFSLNSELFFGINDNINNNFNHFNQKDDVDEKIEKLKYYPKFELENKQNLKEKLDTIFDLENIINQKLFSVQK